SLMENDLLDIWSQSDQSVIFITHDLEEAIGMSDRVIVMTASPGTVLSEHDITIARPRDLLECKLTTEYADTYTSIWSNLKDEVLNAYHRDER
ncbi:ABC transporter ATP-binding protein, partial [Rhodococcus globerulus]|nr:ABC transporter ATP-binding protein [Rhodococcus globerulus]